MTDFSDFPGDDRRVLPTSKGFSLTPCTYAFSKEAVDRDHNLQPLVALHDPSRGGHVWWEGRIHEMGPWRHGVVIGPRSSTNLDMHT